MKYLGLDMSTKSSGFALFDEDKNLVDYGVWKMPQKEEWRLRCLGMGRALADYLDVHTDIEVIHCEDVILSGGNNTKTLIMLSVLQGVILGVAMQRGIFINFIVPSSWRSKLELFSGRRKGTLRVELKDATCKFVNKTFGLDLYYDKDKPKSVKSQDDISDAIGIVYSQIK